MSTAVLIVNFRRYDDLEKCLTSLHPWLDAADEVVVVDYESDTHQLVTIAARHPHATVVPRSDNRGFAAGVNLAASHSRAPYLLLLNPDSVVQGPLLRTLETWLANHPDVGVAGARVIDADGSIQASARRFPDLTTWLGGRSTWLTSRFPRNWFSRRNLVGLTANAPIDVDWVSGACLMTRRDVFERLGGLDEGFFLYWEDADYCRRASKIGFRSMYVPAVTVRHAAGRSSEQDRIPSINAFHQSAYRLYWKHTSPFGRLFAPLVRTGLWLRGQYRIRQSRGL